MNDTQLNKTMKLCPLSCLITTNKTLMFRSDAVIVPPEQFQENNTLLLKTLTDIRQDKIWVFRKGFSITNYLMNSTIHDNGRNFRSEIYIGALIFDNRLSGHDDFSFSQVEFQSLISHKKGLILCKISRCPVSKETWRIIRQLQYWLPLQVTKCCSPPCNRIHVEGREDVIPWPLYAYKFLLLFEDLIEESELDDELRMALEVGTVPVLQLSEKKRRHLPPGSYIRIEDFRDPKDLAEHLYKLDIHNFLFIRYFQWHTIFFLIPKDDIPARGLCQLCELLKK
ncbi:4-galactosyl-N-acetylglucosaminide 3-alpha-L-fucosyltransferase FUT6-like [Tachypleus tridentatus]|uniref:4-galactosyl-N-acetylglucosaminide 3-alpha-L-fucosyltransferase FUT6-like n=1 Tax=Tachypleus tridentatus TaxID=6853 RepID=UPI003FD271DC